MDCGGVSLEELSTASDDDFGRAVSCDSNALGATSRSGSKEFGARNFSVAISVSEESPAPSTTLVGWNEPGPSPCPARADFQPSVGADVVASVASLLRARRRWERDQKPPLQRSASLPSVFECGSSRRKSSASRKSVCEVESPRRRGSRRRSCQAYEAPSEGGSPRSPSSRRQSAGGFKSPSEGKHLCTPRLRRDSSNFASADAFHLHAQVGEQARPILLFDWDDTLLPTHFIKTSLFPTMSAIYSKLPSTSAFEDDLRAYGKLIKRVLRTARAVADVAIITLGAEPWVTNSASWYLGADDMGSFLEDLGIPIFYARGFVGSREKRLASVEEDYDLYMMAKRKAMKACLKRYLGKRWKTANVTSIGDSPVEEEALNEVMWNGHNVVKTVRFIADPSLDLLRMQLEVLLGWLPVLSSHPRDACMRMATKLANANKVYITFVPHHLD